MPVRVVKNLPAIDRLAKENIFVMDTIRAESQDIRPLKILIVNLMPTKETTEAQILRALSNTPLQLDITLLHTESYTSTNTSEEYLETFYRTFKDVQDSFFDGMVVTGAPIELKAFEEVDYWDELKNIMNWSEEHVYSTLYICWGAQAGIYHHFGINKELLPEKLFGVFENEIYKHRPMLVRGMDEVFYMPHSRHTTVPIEKIAADNRLEIIAGSKKTGASVVRSRDNRHIFIFGHSEYDGDTLQKEYLRDLNLGLDITPPENYYPNDDPLQRPLVRWRSTGTLLFSNWLNYYVYQDTPYILEQIKEMKKRVASEV